MVKTKIRYLGLGDDFEDIDVIFEDDEILVGKRSRKDVLVAIKSTKPLIDRKSGDRWFYVKETDIHTHNPRNGKTIDPKLEKSIKDRIVKVLADIHKEDIKTITRTYEPQIEDLTPHELNEYLCASILYRRSLADLLFPPKIRKIIIIALILVGVIIGVMLTLIAIYWYNPTVFQG